MLVYPRREPLLTNIMWRNLIIQALYQVAVLLVLIFRGTAILNLNNDERGNAGKNTLIFNGFVLCQIFNEFNARKPDQMNVFSGVTKSYLFMGIVHSRNNLNSSDHHYSIPWKFTSTVRLDWSLWVVSVVIGIFSWPIAIVGKLIPVPQTPLPRVFSKPYQRCIASRNR